MDIVTILLLAVALAMDCFAVSITNGIATKRFRLFPVLKMAFLFGFFQAFMPFIGWAAGISFQQMIESVDHWIAFGILLVLGCKMIKESLEDDEEDENTEPIVGWGRLIFLSVATSIDALATGLVFLTEEHSTFYLALLMIGLCSFLFTIVGNAIGVYAGKKLPVNMEMVGGFVLIGIGVKILLEHTILS